MRKNSPPESRKPKPHPLSTSTYEMSTSASSSKDTAEPVTPLDTDEEFIDHLWEQVRSKAKSSLDITRAPAEGKIVKQEPAPEREPPKPLKRDSSRLSRQPSLTFRESRDGRNTLAVLHLPGILKADVHVSFQHKRLLVSYKSVEESEKWETDKVIQEVRERRCVRAIPIPESVRPEHIRASMPDHRLFISYPKG